MRVNRTIITICSILILLVLSFLIVSPSHAQTEDTTPALIVDGTVNPSIVELGQEFTVTLSLVGDIDHCDIVSVRRPLDIALVVDRSGSMDSALGTGYQGSKLDAAIEATDIFQTYIDSEEDRVGLVSFLGSASTLSDLGGRFNTRSLIDKMNVKFFSSSGTNIETGIDEAISVIEKGKRENASQVIVLLTDGIESGVSNGRKAAQRAKNAGIRLVTIGLGPDADELMLRDIATQPSDYYYAPESADLSEIYERIAVNIQTYDPASDIQVSYTFDSTNFDLVPDSLNPSANVEYDTITWNHSTLDGNNARAMSFKLKSKVPGEYFAALRLNIQYLACGENFVQHQSTNLFPINVGGQIQPTMLCPPPPEEEIGNVIRFCNIVPWGWVGAILTGLTLLWLWLLKHGDELRNWLKCGFRPRNCIWMDLPWRLWTALIAGLLFSSIANFYCTPRNGYFFWRVFPDRSAAIYLKPIHPENKTEEFTPRLPEGERLGFQTISNENQSMVAVSKDVNGLIVQFNLQGKPSKFPDFQGAYPAWSPDGTKIAFAANNEDLYIYDQASGIVEPVEGASEPGIVETMPAWNPDGQTLAFVRAAGAMQNIAITAPCDIMTIPADGGIPQLVPGASGLGFNYFPSYSPDGLWLAFVHHETGTASYDEPAAEIFLVPSKGGATRRLSANDGIVAQNNNGLGNTWPTWTKDSRYLLFSSRRCDNQYDIFITPIDENGNSGEVSRMAGMSDPDSYEFNAIEATITVKSLLARLLNLWPWLLPLVLFLFTAITSCRETPSRALKDTVILSSTVEPTEGWLQNNQRFEVTVELYGKQICNKIVKDRPVDAVLLIDSSQSMGEKSMGRGSRLSVAKEAAIRFVGCLITENERAAVIHFDDDVHMRCSLTNEESQLLTAIKGIESRGLTSMYAGLLKAITLLQEYGRETGNRVIVLLSDGVPNDAPTEDILRIAEQAKNEGIRIIAIGTGEADETFLRQLVGDNGFFVFAADREALLNSFLSASRQILVPAPAKLVTYTHHYDHMNFELITGSVIPEPKEYGQGTLIWQFDEINERPKTLRYQVKPINPGVLTIDKESEISYIRCGKEPMIIRKIPKSLKVRVVTIGKPVPPPVASSDIEFVSPEIVWQPDQALFIGIGGTGRWVLTHIRKNLLDSGAGKLPDNTCFLLVDTSTRELINGNKTEVNFAGVELPEEDIFVLDENFTELLDDWRDTQVFAKLQPWFDPNMEGTGEKRNLSVSTYGKRKLPRVAIIRNIQQVSQPASKWQKEQVNKNRSPYLEEWIQEKCRKVLNNEKIRIFIVGSLAGGMSGTLVDIANLARLTASQVVPDRSGKVHVEGYVVDGNVFHSKSGNQNIRQANVMANWREIGRWQLNPGYSLSTEWNTENHRKDIINKNPFDDLILFSSPGGRRTDLVNNLYPMIADVMTARLDKASGSTGEYGDWMEQMRIINTQEQDSNRQVIVNLMKAFTYRLPTPDILRSIHAVWAHELIRLFLMGSSKNEVEFKYEFAENGFNRTPKECVFDFLAGNFGGDSDSTSLNLLSYLPKTSEVNLPDLGFIDKLDSNSDNNQDDGLLRKQVDTRLDIALKHILQGTADQNWTSSRAARIAYGLDFLQSFIESLNLLRNEILRDHPNLQRAAIVYREAANQKLIELEKLKKHLSNNEPEKRGLLQSLERIASDLKGTKEDLEAIQCRQYFWGKLQRTTPGDQSTLQLFEDLWWKQYLAGTCENHLKYLAWTRGTEGFDLEIRHTKGQIKLVGDGESAFIEGLMKIAGNLTNDVWKDKEYTSLSAILREYDVFQDEKMADNIKSIVDVHNVLSSGTLSTPAGSSKIIFMAPEAIQNTAKNSPYIKNLEIRTRGGFATNFGSLSSTDRTAFHVLKIQAAIPIDNTEGFILSKREYDQFYGWNQLLKKYDDSGNSIAVMQPESVARQIERSIYFNNRGGDDIPLFLHPLVVASLENPIMAELFCLAFADGLIVEDDRNPGRVHLQGTDIPAPLELCNNSRKEIDCFVDALLYWTLTKNRTQLMIYENALINRFDHLSNTDRLSKWKVKPQAPLNNDNILDRKSLGLFVSTIVRNFLDNRDRRWLNDL